MLQEKSKITSKGQITLPIAIRKRLGLSEGDHVVFDVDETGAVKPRPERSENRSEKYRGVGDFKTKAEALQWLRELRGREE
jgi:AbrB family looped-hinge helix DNA binding protein